MGFHKSRKKIYLEGESPTLTCLKKDTKAPFKVVNIRTSKLSIKAMVLKVVSATFLLVCFVCLKTITCKTRKNGFYFTLKALFIYELIKL